jgi:DNA-binding LacI/PurR family transcriptional regulator
MNIVEFAKAAKVSTATVSRAFHEQDKLRPETRTRILALARSIGYYPNPSGRAMKRGRYDVVGLIWPLEVEGPEADFAQRVLGALTQHLVARDLDLLLCPVDRRESSTVSHAARTLARSRCDSWILLYPRRNDKISDALRVARKPVVCLMGAIPGSSEWRSVQLDQTAWMADALARLARAGCRRVALYGKRPGELDHEERHDTFLELAPRWFKSQAFAIPEWPPDPTGVAKEFRENRIDGIIGIDDRAAVAAMQACRLNRLAVPAQVKVVGIDDSQAARHAQPALSSYRQPLDEMAGCALEIALGERKRSRRFEATFVGRESLPG